MKYFNQNIEHEETTPEVNMSPLIDMVFLLLIFFMVTTVFVQDTGMEIQRPQANAVQPTASNAIHITLTPQGDILMDGKRLTIHQVRQALQDTMHERSRPVLIIADEKAQAGQLVKLIDQCRMAEVTDVAVAATLQTQP